MDTETARSLRRSTSPGEEPLPEPSHPSPAPQALPLGTPCLPPVSGEAHSEGDSEAESAASSLDESPPGLSSSSTDSSVSESDTDASSTSIAALHDAFKQSVRTRHASGLRPQASVQASTSASASYPPLLSIPYTSNAQSLAAAPFSKASSRVACHASKPSLHVHAGRCMSSGAGRLRNQACCRGRAAARRGKALSAYHSTAGLSAAACCSGFRLSSPLSSTWQLHATRSDGTTAEIASSEVASSPSSSLDAAADSSDEYAPSDVSDAVQQALDEAAIIDRRSSHQQASSSSSSQDNEDVSSSSGSLLLSTKHNESTLSLDLSSLPEPASPLPPPQPMTKQPGQQARLGQASNAAALLKRKGHNESTISLDLDDLPTPPELIQRPARPTPPSRDANGLFPNMPNSLDWDDLQVEQPPRSRPAPIPSPTRREPETESWDNLPLFRPPPPPPQEAQQAASDMAVDLMFSALQSKRYKHVKGTSYKDATFALVPVDRKVRSVLLKTPCRV